MAAGKSLVPLQFCLMLR